MDPAGIDRIGVCQTCLRQPIGVREMASQIVMDRTGDTRHIFDNQDRAEVAKAERRFKELTGAGFTAAVRSGPGEQRVIRSFDPTVDAVLSASGWRLTAVSQPIMLAVGSFGLALLGTLLLSALLPVVRSGSSETRGRALTLLKQWLSPEQRACYERFRYFDVTAIPARATGYTTAPKPTLRN
jgi:hypothetical protein